MSSLTLPGEYRFRADKPAPGSSGDGTQYWSAAANNCTIPGCIQAAVTLPGGGAAAETRTIAYTYDGLNRLITAV